MGKKSQKSGRVLNAVFVDDTKTFHYFSVADEEGGVIGNIYWPKTSDELPSKVVLNLLNKGHKDRNKLLDLLISKTNGKGKTYKRLVAAKNR